MIMQNPNRIVTVTPSKFAMWRAAIALAYGDSMLSNSETNLIHEYWKNYAFTDEQQRQLDLDLQKGIKLDDVWPQITDKLDRANLINFALVLFHIDGDYTAAEQALFEEMNNRHMGTIDLRQAMRDARSSVEQYLQEDKAKLDEDYKNQPAILKPVHYLLFYGERNSDYTFPDQFADEKSEKKKI